FLFAINPFQRKMFRPKDKYPPLLQPQRYPPTNHPNDQYQVYRELFCWDLQSKNQMSSKIHCDGALLQVSWKIFFSARLCHLSADSILYFQAQPIVAMLLPFLITESSQFL